jgi:hypothetical protein
MDIQVEYGKPERYTQCIFCLKWQNSCLPFRILENSSLPPLFRTLYTFKCCICPSCKDQGPDFVKQRVLNYMDEYAGGTHEVLRSSGI